MFSCNSSHLVILIKMYYDYHFWWKVTQPSCFYIYLLVEGVSESSLFDCSNSKQRYYPAPSDCHSFYQCFDKIGPPVKMSCGFLHFNPIASACDWPANVINIRPECDKTFKNFGRRRQFGRKLTTSTPSSTTPSSSMVKPNSILNDGELKVWHRYL